MNRYMYLRKNGGMRFWRVGDIGGSIYISHIPHGAERKADAAIMGLAIANTLLLLLIAAQRLASYY